MKSKKFRIILISVLSVIVLATTAILLIVLNGDKRPEDEDYVTVSFETNGGSVVSPLQVLRGETIEKLPQTYLAGSSFIGWFSDETLENSFFSGTAIEQDITLYAGFVASEYDLEESVATEYLAENCVSDLAVQFICDNDYGEDDFLKHIQIEAISGELPQDFKVEKDGNIYTLTALNGYTEGKLYKITVPSDIRFKDLSEDISEFSFRIQKDESEIVVLSEEVIYVAYSDVYAYSDLSSEDVNCYQLTFRVKKDEINAFFKDLLSAAKGDKEGLAFETDDVICFGSNREYDYEESVFIKIADISSYEQEETFINVVENDKGEQEAVEEKYVYTYYVVLAVDADVEDVYSYVDVKFDQLISSNSIINQIDTEEILNSVYESGAFDKVTTLVSTLLSESDSIQTALEYDKTQTNYAAPDFTSNAYVYEDSLESVIKFDLAKGANVSISLGEGHNPNFLSNYTDNFVVLKVQFSYNATIKKKVKIKVEFTLVEYVAVSMQGYLDYEYHVFGDKWLDFDYALNIYSQTDIDMSILFCSVDDDEYRDISKEINDKLSEDGGDEGDNLVQQLKDMLDSESGDIELFRTNMLHIDTKIIPIVPIMQVNIDFDFLVKMNFAAGLSTDISILEATQVGITGDTREDYIKSYKHDLYGGNRYSIELTACGYVGIKAGFEGSLSVSFCCLSKLGKVGVSVFVGPYVDLYGFAQLTLTKDNYRTTTSLIGGYYVEVGMNLEIELVARSDLFKVKAGVTLLDVKWPLISFGNKEVLLYIDGSDLDEVFIAGEAGDLDVGEYNTATLSLDTLSPLQGKYIDITTGEIVSRDIPWTNVFIRFSNYKFTFDMNTKIITYKNGNVPRPASEECTVYYYYTGPCLQFNLTSAQSQDYYPFGTSRIVYYDKSIVSQESAGKTFTANVYTELDGVKTLVDSYDVLAGTCLRFIETGIDRYQYMDVSWNIDPKTVFVVEDIDFIQYGYTRQYFVSFVYYEEGEDVFDPGKWYTEIKVVDLGEKPIVPTLPEDGVKTTFKEWYVTTTAGLNYVGNEVIAVPSLEDLKNAGYYSADVFYTHGQNTSEPFFKYQNESSITLQTDLFEYYRNGDEAQWGAIVKNVYFARYEEQDCTVTMITDIDDNEWQDGCFIEDSYNVEYGQILKSHYILSELKYRFKGFSFTKDGSIEDIDLFNCKLYKDLTLYMIYEPIVHSVTLQYYDDKEEKYVDYKEYSIGRNWELGKIDIDYDGAAEKLVKVDGVEYTLLSWQYRYDGQQYKDYATETSLVFHDIEIYPVYRRKVSLTLDPGEGEKTFASLEGYYTDSVFDYTTYVGNLCYKAPDENGGYNHTGWKNVDTGMVYPINKVYCKYPATFVAVYTPKTYSFTVETTMGVLPNGEQSMTVEGLYAEYLEYVEYYLDEYRPANVYDDDNHCYYTADGCSKYADGDGNVYSIKYENWKKVLYKYTVKIDADGGDVVFASNESGKQIYDWENSIEYGANFYLTNVFATKQDEYATYKLIGWRDDDGNVYGTSDAYIVLKNTLLTAVWEVEKYFEYTVTYYLNDEKYDEKTYRFNAEIDLSQPEETIGLAFTEWTLYDAETNNEIDKVTKMPSKNLIAKAYSDEVFIYYVVDDEQILKTHGDVGSTYDVNDKYVKRGYTVTEWQTDDVTVVNNSFVMPKKDVTFKATTSINSYTITYKHNGVVYKEESVKYGTFVTLIDAPDDESGITYVWNSDDVDLVGTGFPVPDHDVLLTTTRFEKSVRIVYYVDGAVYGYLITQPGKTVTLIDKPNGVENWYVNNENVTSILVGNDDVFVYSERQDEKYKITFNVDNGLDYNGVYTAEVVAGERYNLPSAPVLSSYMTDYKTDGWYSMDAEILTDSDGNYYIVMPYNNVSIHAFAYPDNTGGKVATTYLVLDGQEIEFLKYNVVDNDVPVYFEYPSVNGYQFVHWLDSDGNVYTNNKGVTLNSMNGTDKNFYAIYRKVELHVATFILNGEIVGYDAFYDYNAVTLNTPTVTLGDGEEFSGWLNPYVSLYDFGYGGTLYLNEDDSPIGMDLIFQGFTYKTGSVAVQIDYTENVKSSVVLSLKEGQTVKLLANHLGVELLYSVKAYGYSTGDTVEYTVCNATIVREGDYYLISLPNTDTLKSDDLTLDFAYFVINVAFS